MSDQKEGDIEKTRRELEQAVNELRKKVGLPFIKRSGHPEEPPYCSFCARGKNHVEAMVAGPDVFICNECVELRNKILAGRNNGEQAVNYYCMSFAMPFVSPGHAALPEKTLSTKTG